jgi:hypothetical protein
VRIVEQFVIGKHDDPGRCEDAVIVTGDFAAVVDGATDTSGALYGGVAGGLWAMRACVDAVESLPADIDAPGAVAAMTRTLARRVDPGLPAASRPSASATVYSARRREVWQVGDVGFHHQDMAADAGRPRKLVDEIASCFRAAFVAAEAAAGHADPAGSDAARTAVRAFISRQGVFRNAVGPYGYAGIDGRPVPVSLVVVHPVPDGVDELVLASDGYPRICPTLAESEALLARMLVQDPWCITVLKGTKGVAEGQISYDDRAYLRLRVDDPAAHRPKAA